MPLNSIPMLVRVSWILGQAESNKEEELGRKKWLYILVLMFFPRLQNLSCSVACASSIILESQLPLIGHSKNRDSWKKEVAWKVGETSSRSCQPISDFFFFIPLIKECFVSCRSIRWCHFWLWLCHREQLSSTPSVECKHLKSVLLLATNLLNILPHE